MGFKLMKKFLTFIFAVVGICGLLISCEKLSVNLDSNDADFTVTNMTTGKSISNKGVQVSIGAENEFLEVKNGDVLELVYVPNANYQKYSWSVDFNIFDNKIITVSKSPYKHTITTSNISQGLYNITCKASINDKDIDSEGFVTGTVKIKVIE